MNMRATVAHGYIQMYFQASFSNIQVYLDQPTITVDLTVIISWYWKKFSFSFPEMRR